MGFWLVVLSGCARSFESLPNAWGRQQIGTCWSLRRQVPQHDWSHRQGPCRQFRWARGFVLRVFFFDLGVVPCVLCINVRSKADQEPGPDLRDRWRQRWPFGFDIRPSIAPFGLLAIGPYGLGSPEDPGGPIAFPIASRAACFEHCHDQKFEPRHSCHWIYFAANPLQTSCFMNPYKVVRESYELVYKP